MPQEGDDARPARLGPDAVARTTFPTSFRGYDPEQVRVFLEKIADDLREARDREAALRAQLESAEARAEAAAHPDEAQLTAALGEETARVLLAAREAAAEIRSKGEESVARLLREAQDDASRMKAEAETILSQRTKEAETAAALIREAAEAELAEVKTQAEAAVAELRATGEAAANEARLEVERIRADAAAQAEEVLETAKAQGRDMVDEAILVRTRVLEDLSRRRKVALVQVERLQAGRDRLIESYDTVRRTLAEATEELQGSLVAAKREADAAARRVESEPEPTAAELEAEVDAAREAGLPLVRNDAPDEPFDEELPEGDMVPIDPSAEFEEVRVIETGADQIEQPVAVEDREELEEVVADVVVIEDVTVVDDAVVVDETVVLIDETEDDAPDVDVDDLFARIRAARADEVAKAHEVLGDTQTEREANPVANPDLDVEAPTPSDATAANDITPPPATPDEQALLERRDAATDAAEQKATRKLKRVLADEQNEVLDRLRRNAKAKITDVLPAPDEHAARYADAALPALNEAAQAGASFYGGNGSATSVEKLATQLGEALAHPLRERVSDSIRDAGGDDDALADGVRAAYRDWKSHRIGMQTRDVVFAAFNLGLYDATAEGTTLRWLVDDGGSPCPDAEDNSLAGLVVKGEPYPTGHCHPPAHPGCRCLLVPTAH